MATYTGKTVTINRPAAVLFERFSTMDMLQQRVASLPDEVRDKMGEVRFESDRMIVVTPQVGEIAFAVKERTAPSRIVFTAVGAPVPLDLAVNFKETSAESTEVTTRIDVDIPMMLRPMVGPHLQKAADMFGDLMAGLSAEA